MNTGKYVGFMRFGSPVINMRPRNVLLGNVPDLPVFNKTAIMGFVIVPSQPFGYNYLGVSYLHFFVYHTLQERHSIKYLKKILHYLKPHLFMALLHQHHSMMD